MHCGCVAVKGAWHSIQLAYDAPLVCVFKETTIDIGTRANIDCKGVAKLLRSYGTCISQRGLSSHVELIMNGQWKEKEVF